MYLMLWEKMTQCVFGFYEGDKCHIIKYNRQTQETLQRDLFSERSMNKIMKEPLNELLEKTVDEAFEKTINEAFERTIN